MLTNKEKQSKEGNMQIITEIPDGKPGRPDNQRSRFLKCQPGRDLPKKTEVATGRKRNAFLTGKVSPIATDYYMENETDETETNLTTSENFDFLYRSALRYAGLMGIKLPFRPRKGGSPRMNIAGLYRAMDEALPEQVNLEEKAGRLYFCLYRFHEWPDYTLFWIPIDFIEKISVPVRCIVREFIRRFIRHHGLNMVKETWYYELALEELRDWKNRDPDASPQEVRRNSLLAESYDNGKISKALKRMEGKPFCVRLEDKIRECRTEAKRERDLLGLVSEGLELITPDSPCLIQYYYDWAYEKEPDFPPIGLDTQIMLAYSNNDMLAENMESYFNSDCRETYTITPVTYMYLTPETDRLFRMDDYPERLSKWMQRFMQHIAGSF